MARSLVQRQAVTAGSGLRRSLTNNMMVGLSEGFTKELVLNGVGYRAQTDSGALTMNLGYSHIVGMTIPKDIQCTVTGPPTPSPQPHAAKPPSLPSSTHLPARWPDPPRCCRPFALLVLYSSPHALLLGRPVVEAGSVGGALTLLRRSLGCCPSVCTAHPHMPLPPLVLSIL